LGPILDANGWAVNARAKINVPFGASLTRVAALPAGAQRDLADPFAEKKTPWGLYCMLFILLLLVVGWLLGKFDGFLPDSIKSPITQKAPTSTNAPVKPGPPESAK